MDALLGRKPKGKVALDVRMLAHSGIGTHVRGLIEGLSEAPACPSMVLVGPGRLLQGMKAARGFDLLEWDAPIYSIREQLSFPARDLKRRGVAAFHSPHYNMPLFAGGLKRIVTVHDIIHLLFQEGMGAAKRFYAKTMMAKVAAKADRILTVSNYTRGDLNRELGIGIDRIQVAPNAAGSAFARRPDDAAIAAVRDRLRLPARYMLALGINKPHKNFPFLVKACAAMWIRGRTDVPLVVAGVPADEAEPYRSIAREQGMPPNLVQELLAFPGKAPWEDVPALYAGATLLAFPSLYEGFGLPVVEAQTLGVPVVASRAASIPEVAGDGAELFDPTDLEDAERALLSVLDNPSRQAELADLGLQNAQRFSWLATAQTVATVYRDLLAEGN